MNELIKLAEELETESQTFVNLAFNSESTGEVRLHTNVVIGFAKRFAKMADLLRKMAEDTNRRAS